MTSELLASIIRVMFFRTHTGMCELLFAIRHFPVLVIHTFVAFSVGPPCEMCTWIGSNGLPSFVQKYTQ